MELNINTVNTIFSKLSERPNKTNEMSVIIKDTLNETFGDNIKCHRVFITEDNGTDPFYISVIPKKPDSKILKKKYLKEYDIDIDLSAFNNNYNRKSFTASEMTAWLLHEIAANLLTDETLLRFKKLIVKYYDTKDNMILDTIDTYGILLWIGIFSRTKKTFSKDNLDPVNILLKQWGVSESWDSALNKYISSIGGNMQKLTDEYIHSKDKVQLRQFNELARKYSSYSLKYNNTEYSTMVKYIMNTTKSELIKHYISKEPQCVPTHSEKMIFILFDDTKLLLESVDEIRDDEKELYNEVKVTDLIKKTDELKVEINNIVSESDKLLCSAKLKELSRIIDSKFEDASLNSSKDLLQKVKYDTEELIDKIKEKDVSEHISMRELD